MKSVTIIGAGWAGLAAAVELTHHGIPVTVYESAQQVGGRARNTDIHSLQVDNGQHLMIGAYHQMLTTLQQIGINTEDVFHRIPQHVRMLDMQTGNTLFELKLRRIPAPWHLVTGMLACPSLTPSEKIKTLLQFNSLLKKDIAEDMSVDDWLVSASMPQPYIEHLLKPLCLAALTSPTHQASARCFQTVLRQTFFGPRENTDLLIPRTTLGNIFPKHAVDFIHKHGGHVHLEHRVNAINVQNKTLHVNDHDIPFDRLILATPAGITAKLLSEHTLFSSLTKSLSTMQFQPVTTIYLQYPASVSLPLPMMGCLNSQTEWLFDRQYCNQPGLIAAVISADGPHMDTTQESLAGKIAVELSKAFPHWPQPISTHVIREKRACFLSHINVDTLRPRLDTPDPNIKLCGDYVFSEPNNQAGLPATLEAAMRSGVKCALRFIEDRH